VYISESETKMDKLLYGAAYYDEYMPYERLDKDIELMKKAGINLVRIAESTWSTHEPQDGVFDFTSVDRVLDAMYAAGIHVIVGTPTYAIPAWLAAAHPEILAVTSKGAGKYGARQNMDITSSAYLFYAERIIRQLISHVCRHPAVIGYQIDNETKHYGTLGPNVQQMFVKYMRAKFPSLDDLNQKMGLAYWSNRINSWEEFPSTEGTINASLAGEFSTFQRKLVTDFLAWQASIVNEYKQDGQFVTHNFDFDWRGYSFGIQSDVDHFAASKVVDIAGCDIYHPSQEALTGAEIAMGGDIIRSLKKDNYLVLETQAQAFAAWTPFPGQLRLQAFSHLASGADCVEYWHYHSIHNSFETYWKGLLSHDFEPGPTYEEACTIGKDFARLSDHLIHLRKSNKAALLVSNESLTALKNFAYCMSIDYNAVMRQMYDALYKMNIECDFIGPDAENLTNYQVIVVPPLYAASDVLLNRLNRFAEQGGHVVYGIRSGFSDENVKVRVTHQPGIIGNACGTYYDRFVSAEHVTIKSGTLDLTGAKSGLSSIVELLEPKGSQILASYEHPYWGQYAAITQKDSGTGSATYIGCCPDESVYAKVFEQVCKKAGLWGVEQTLAFPMIVRSGTNQSGRKVHYIFNYSMEKTTQQNPYGHAQELLSGREVQSGESLVFGPWDLVILEEK